MLYFSGLYDTLVCYHFPLFVYDVSLLSSDLFIDSPWIFIDVYDVLDLLLIFMIFN